MANLAQEYISRLSREASLLQHEIDAVVAKHAVCVVGTGYIDIITPMARTESFVDAATALGVMISAMTLWCDCTPANTRQWGCPHGYGGPRYGEDCYYSEMCGELEFGVVSWEPLFDGFESVMEAVAAQHRRVRTYLQVGIKEYRWYSPCLVPGFWLAVPDEWVNANHRAAPTPRA